MHHSPSTQPLPEEQSPPGDETDKDNKLGYLIANNCWYEIPVGETKIGRDASLCSVVLDDETVSKIHAVVESEGAEDTFIYDAGSMNKSRIGKMKLKPHCRYKINDNDVITIGGVNIKFKVINCKTKNDNMMKTPKLYNNGEISMMSDNANLYSPIDKHPNKSNTEEVFKSPSMSIFKPQMRQVNKHYYIPVGGDSPALDIFSQATQYEVTDTKDNSFRSDISQVKCISDDDIYNLSTQCEYAGDFIKPKNKILTMTGSPKCANGKVMDCDFNDPGSFDFMNEKKFGKCITSNGDIFELATQYPTKSVDDELNFKNKINQPINSKESVKTNNEKSGVQDEEGNLISLSDGEDEELCKLMRMNSPSLSKNDSTNVFKDNLIKTEFSDDSNEIFDVATQVPGMNDNERGNSSKNNLGNHHRVIMTEGGFKKPEAVPRLDEDMILTQVFNSRHVPEGVKAVGAAESGKSDNPEDLIATQLFPREGQITRAVTHCSQDDIATQVFPLKDNPKVNGDEPNKENQILSVIIEEPPPKPVPDLVELCDSGDETESDLEVKLCLEKGRSSDIFKKEPGVELRDRPSTASSDKTVSDLDVAELEKASSSVLERIDCEDFIETQILPSKPKASQSRGDQCEDLIPTQRFPAENGTRPANGYDITEVSSEEDNCDIEDNSNESESLIKEIEDFSSSSPIMATVQRRLTTPSPGRSHATLTLTPSNPVFEAFSEIDVLIGKTNDKSDSGIGAENIFEGNERCVPDVRVPSDSDETDCEEELQAVKAKLEQQERICHSKPNTDPVCKASPTVRSEDIHPSTSNPRKSLGKSLRSRTSTTKPKKPDSIKSYFPSKPKEGNDSPLKRTLLTNSDEGIPKKRVKSVETRKKKGIDNLQTDGVILTQSLALRNRVIRQRKTTPDCKRASETPGSGMTECNAIETVLRMRGSKEKTPAIRKLVEEFQVLQESGKKKLRQRKSNGDDWKGIDSAAMKIVFTGFESDCHDRIIQKLGGVRVNHLDDGHVLVTDRVRRTVKFLSAVALGLPIVSPKWLIASERETKFLNPWNFLLEDKPSEERWGFNLKATIDKWRKQKLLKGYTVYATESTRPPVHEILSIVKCCGGSPVTSQPDTWPEKSIVLTCVDDKKTWPPVKYRQVKIVHYEILLSGVLKHFMDFKTYKLR